MKQEKRCMRKNKNKNLSSDETKKVPSVPPAGDLAEAVQKSEEKTDIDAQADKALKGGEGSENEISAEPEASSVEERETSTESGERCEARGTIGKRNASGNRGSP